MKTIKPYTWLFIPLIPTLMLATLHTNSVQVTPTEQTNNFQAFLIQTTLENTESTTVTDGSKPDHQHPSNLVSAKKQNQYSDNQDLYYAKATFDFNIKCLPNGQLEHGTDTDIRLRSTSIDRIVILGNKATFNGTAIVNGEEEHTFNVTVVDTGEPGKVSDMFSITIYKNQELSYKSDLITLEGVISKCIIGLVVQRLIMESLTSLLVEDGS